MKPENSPFFREDVVNLHLVVTQQFTCVGVENLPKNFITRSDVKQTTVAATPTLTLTLPESEQH